MALESVGNGGNGYIAHVIFGAKVCSSCDFISKFVNKFAACVQLLSLSHLSLLHGSPLCSQPSSAAAADYYYDCCYCKNAIIGSEDRHILLLEITIFVGWYRDPYHLVILSESCYLQKTTYFKATLRVKSRKVNGDMKENIFLIITSSFTYILLIFPSKADAFECSAFFPVYNDEEEHGDRSDSWQVFESNLWETKWMEHFSSSLIFFVSRTIILPRKSSVDITGYCCAAVILDIHCGARWHAPSVHDNLPGLPHSMLFSMIRQCFKDGKRDGIHAYFIGFVHTAYTFANESRVLESGAAGNDVPMGALINIIQKGIYYTEAEACAVASTSAAGEPRTEKTVVENLSLLEAVLNEVPSNKIKEKQQDKLLLMNPAVKNDRQLQQTRDREMREVHSEKQNYSISKSRELKDLKEDGINEWYKRVFRNCTYYFQVAPSTSATMLPFASAGQSSSTTSGNGNGSNPSIMGIPTTSASTLLPNNHQQFHPVTSNITGQPALTFPHHGKQFFLERERESRDRSQNGLMGKAKVAAAEFRAAQANNGDFNGTPMEIDGLKPRVNNGNGILSTAQLENRPYEISRDKVRYLKGHDSEVFICTWNPKMIS
ncbi:hypothetical protein DINM_006354 [Dirofilaria immitis]|nr:hypothetical protein [Dirofilaria immitis]